jgi:protein-S-isoprenylcysteine O-methyltransferase Ste14
LTPRPESESFALLPPVPRRDGGAANGVTMSEEFPYQLAVAGLLVALKLVRLPVRRLMHPKVVWRDLKKNPLDLALLLLLSAMMLTALIGYWLQPAWLVAGAIKLPAWLRVAGVGLGLFGCALIYWGDAELGENLSPALRIRDGHTLVTTGPFRYVRNPIYLGAILYCTSFLFVAANWIVGGLCIGGFTLLLAVRIPHEERMMAEQFGRAYRDYQARTGCLLPGLFRGETDRPQ